MLKERQFLLNHITLNALTLGDESKHKTCVLFLHGWLDNAASFDSCIRQFSLYAQEDSRQKKYSDEMYVVAIDLAGHGLSSHRHLDNFYNFQDYISDLYEVIKQLEFDRLVLVGHSLGALIQLCYAGTFPEDVDKLILIDAIAPLTEPADLSVKRLKDGIKLRERLANKLTSPGYATFDDGLTHKAQVTGLSELQLKPIVQRGLEFKDERWRWRYDLKLKHNSLYRMTPEQAISFIKNISCPTLAILGSQGAYEDTAKTQKMLEFYADFYQQLTRVTLDGGHYCHVQNPNYTAQLLFDFIFE